MNAPETPEAGRDRPTFRLIVGLGNPGRDYAFTRHNVGFMIVDRLVARAGLKFAKAAKWDAEIATASPVIFCKPLTYMNLSGQSVAAMASYHRIPPDRLLVISDDAALPPGKLRLRLRGSAGGHNGLQSIFDHVGTEEVARLRVGVGETGRDAPLREHVLGRFTAAELAELEPKFDRAVEAVEFAQKNSAEAAMNLYNSENNNT